MYFVLMVDAEDEINGCNIEKSALQWLDATAPTAVMGLKCTSTSESKAIFFGGRSGDVGGVAVLVT